MSSPSLLIIAGLITLLTAGCVAEVKQAEQRTLITVPATKVAEPIRFERLVMDIRRGTPIGGFRLGLQCRINNTDVTWGGGRINASTVESADIFYHEMVAAGYEVLGNPTSLFKEPDDKRASFGVGGRITEIQLALCDAVDFFGRSKGISGDAYLKVQWQVFDKLERKVVFDTITEGTFKNPSATLDGEMVAINGALANAVANLAADPRFHELLTSGASNTQVAAGDQSVITFPSPPPSASPIVRQMDRIRSSVVTILSDGGHGSGFFISKEGHILTNQHVVGGAKMVKVRLLSGREMMGEVIRSHKHRDVALVLIEEKGYSPLPLRLREPGKVGEEAYAIGTPLMENLSTTVSRGIISAIRRNPRNGQEDLQSDVDIHAGNSGGPLLDSNGNVIGVSYAGYGGEATSVGLNLFVPIADALDKLNLKPKDDRSR